jgi:imidazolonepropionase-like amidohydrolase
MSRLVDVVVVDPRDGSRTPHQDVTLDGDRIAAVTATAGPAGPDDVEGAGRFLVPGYVDMHAHPLNQPDPRKALRLMLSFGITGYRQMSGSPDLLARRRTLDREGPRLLALSGDLLTPMNAGTPEAAAAEVARQAEQGADFVKAALITADVLPAAQAAAAEHGIPVLGHLPVGVDVRAASRAGFRSIEHIGPGLGVLAGCSCHEEQVRAEQPTGPRIRLPRRRLPLLDKAIGRLIAKAVVNPSLRTPPQTFAATRHALDTFDEDKSRALAAQFVADGTWNCPTLIRIKTQQLCDRAEFPADPDLRYTAPGTLTTWRKTAGKFHEKFSAEQHETFAQLWEMQLRLTRILAEEGVGILAGSDAVGAAWVVPGSSLHREFDLLAEAGLSPLRILQSATTAPARFLGREVAIAPGAPADLVLLDADPTAAVENLHAVSGVVARGVPRSAADLAAEQDSLAGQVP